MWLNTPGLLSPPLPRSWLAGQGCATGSPHLIWCFAHFHLFNVTVSSLHLLSTVLLCIQVFVEENTVLDVPAYFLLIPFCPTQFETRLLFARQAGCVLLSIVSSDQYLGFSNVLQTLRINVLLWFQQPKGVWQDMQAGYTAGHLWSEFSWISYGAWKIDNFIYTEGTEQFGTGQVTPEPSGEVVHISYQATRGR